jgi:hypothetical protein
MNSEIKQTHFEAVWERLKGITGWRTTKELAQFVGSSPQSISGVKKRGKFPLDWAHSIAKAFESSTDFIMDGRTGNDQVSNQATGEGIVQGRSIEADELHIDVHNHFSKEHPEAYNAPIDPLDAMFLKDWHKLSEPGMMRVWTLLKEEIQRESGELK